MPLTIENLCKSFGDKTVLNHLNLTLEDGGIYCLMGPSGMGKTTLLRIIMNLETKDSGSITGIDPEKEISAMFQEDRILPYLTPVQNVNMMYEQKRPSSEIRKDLEMILPKRCLRQPACELSGGMKRRVSLARTVHFQGKMIILDEPFTGLDYDTKRTVIQYILKNRGDRILLVATHGVDDAALLGGEVIRLEECQDTSAFTEAASGKETKPRQLLVTQARQLLQDLTDEQLQLLLEHASEMLEQERTKNRNLYPLIERMQMQGSRIALMNDIPKERWHQVLSMLDGWERHYEAGQMIWNIGDVSRALPVILEGEVAAYTINEKGRKSLIARFTEGHCFGEMLAVNGIASPVAVYAEKEAAIMYLPIAQLRACGYENREDVRGTLLWRMIQEMADKINLLTGKLEPIRGTMTSALLEYLKNLPDMGNGRKRMVKQMEIAQDLNVRRESISRAMQKLERLGVIVWDEMDSIRILKPDWTEPLENRQE